MEQFFQNVWASTTKFFNELGNDADVILLAVIKIIGILILARIVMAVARRVSRRIVKSRIRRNPLSDSSKKAETMQTVSYSVIKYVVYFFTAMAVLDVIGLGAAVSSMLAAAGIGGIVIALGAQSLVKDVVSGMFMLLENQYAVGEYVKVDDEEGTVDAVTMRTTTINRFTGESVTIPNGSITKVVNYSRNGHLAIIDIPVTYETDIEAAGKIMLEAGLAYKKEHDNILEEPRILGIIECGENNMVIRMVMQVQPLTHWATERALRQAVMEAFAQKGLSSPYPRRVVVNS